MLEYDEFRLLLGLDPASGGRNWTIEVREAPVEEFVGIKGTVTPQFTNEQLVRLRTASGWANRILLKEIGDSVWKSLSDPNVDAILLACLKQAKNNGRGLRIVVATADHDRFARDENAIRLSELPIEAIWREPWNFFAPSISTPVSRSLQVKADVDPAELTLPLRVLVVIASPNGLPKADIVKEGKFIETAFKPLVDSGAVVLDILSGATALVLKQHLEKQYHVVHFLAHGGFDVVGNDPSARAYISLQTDEGDVAPLDGEVLDLLLRDTDVRLVVLSACSSAAPTPEATPPEKRPYRIGAFDGIAQRLIAPISAVRAVVGMQFDMESDASIAFNGAFYRKMLERGIPLDAVVAHARLAVIVKMDVGHRAWVTPTLYSRCRDGILFDIKEIRNNLDDETRKSIVELDSKIAENRSILEELARHTDEYSMALRSLRDEYRSKIEELTERKNQLLGNSIRLWGGRAKPGEVVSCRLTLRLRSPAAVRNIKLVLMFPPKAVVFKGHRSEAHGEKMTVNMRGLNGMLQVSIRDVSHGDQWDRNEYDLAVFDFEVGARTSDPIVTVRVSDIAVDMSPAMTVSNLDGVIFVADSARRARQLANAEAQVAKALPVSWPGILKDSLALTIRSFVKDFLG
jgi:hypothetical protein